MKLKQTLRYHLLDCRLPMLIFYGIVVITIVLSLVGAITFRFDSDLGIDFQGSTCCFELASLIFLFVVGICFLIEPLPMLIQNGVSRRTIFGGSILAQTVFALGMALIDRGLCYLSNALFTVTGSGVEAVSMFDMLYASNYFVYASRGFGLWTMIPGLGLYFLALAIGMTIYLMYCRLSKLGRIGVSIAVPVFLLFGLPILDEVLFSGYIEEAMAEMIQNFFLFGANHPLLSLGLDLVITAVLWGICWLLLRRMPLKK